MWVATKILINNKKIFMPKPYNAFNFDYHNQSTHTNSLRSTIPEEYQFPQQYPFKSQLEKALGTLGEAHETLQAIYLDHFHDYDML